MTLLDCVRLQPGSFWGGPVAKEVKSDRLRFLGPLSMPLHISPHDPSLVILKLLVGKFLG